MAQNCYESKVEVFTSGPIKHKQSLAHYDSFLLWNPGSRAGDPKLAIRDMEKGDGVSLLIHGSLGLDMGS